MKKDPIVEEIRRNRAEIAKRFNGDVIAIVKDAQRRQKLSKRRSLSFFGNA